MMVCIHYPFLESQPAGVWYWDDAENAPKSFYLPGKELYRFLGAQFLTGCSSQQQWNVWAKRMSERTPVSSSFEIDDIYIRPEIYLVNLRKLW